MKVFLLCLAIVPFIAAKALTAEEELVYKRWLLKDYHLPSVNDLGQKIIQLLGSDTSEAACEAACPKALNALVPGAGFLSGQICGSACHWVQGQIQG